MNYSTVNITTPEPSTNSSPSYGLLGSLEICVYSIYVLLAFPTHSYVIWLIVTGRGSGIASELFHLNLSICEICNSMNSLFVVLSAWGLGPTILIPFLIGLVITGRPLFQCLICVERYLAVIHPVTFLKYKPLRYRLMCCTAVWIITLGSCLFCMFTIMANHMNAYRLFLLLQFLVYLSIQLFFCVAVLRALKQSGPGERGREREEENHMKKRAFIIILITAVNMVIVYVPFTIAALINMFTVLNIQPLWNLGFICFALAVIIQPVLYLQRFMNFSCL